MPPSQMRVEGQLDDVEEARIAAAQARAPEKFEQWRFAEISARRADRH